MGDAWELENCWAFYQGFYSAKQDYSIEFPHLDDEPQDELLARIEALAESASLATSTALADELISHGEMMSTKSSLNYVLNVTILPFG